MTTLLAIPLVVRLLLLFLCGLVLGGLVNWAVYYLAWNRRSISPWSRPLPTAPPRKLHDRLPVVGWLGLRREAKLHGPRFWIRPLAVELLSGVALVMLYLWETHNGTRLWAFNAVPLPSAEYLSENLPLAEHLSFLSHAILFNLMLVASLIDLDEKTIPDGITVPGAIVALVLAAAYPWSFLPAAHYVHDSRVWLEFLQLASPNPFPDVLDYGTTNTGLLVALGCWSLWCFALLPRRWNVRHGWNKAVAVFWRRLRKESFTYVMGGIWIVGAAAIWLVAKWLGVAHWAGLLTALVGLAAGGGVIWSVRIVGQAVLKKEAMGFGDVTLMAMIGAFLGWQVCLMIFFIAPFFAILYAVGNLVINSDHEIPYGPFLCLGALTAILKWPALWANAADVFSLGWLVPVLIVICMVLMALLLGIYQLFLRLLGRAD